MSAWRTISLWMDQLDEPLLARPALERDLDVDVAIIGAGYTGLWTAYYLKNRRPAWISPSSRRKPPGSVHPDAMAAG